MNQKITEEHLRRRAIVYVRQSTPIQLVQNRESQLRQYGLAEHARKLGFRDVETIDADLGRSGSGLEERPGFQRLVTEVCSGQVGAVLCIEASRLARNGRDWHQLFELCGLVGALVIEPDGVYDPRLINDRLLLGLKGIMNEFELTLMRQRSVAAIWQKARRGELQCRIPVGFCWTEDGRIELNPDRRVQQAIRHIFDKFAELGSVHQVFLSFREDGILVPFARFDHPGETVEWKPARYRSLHAVLGNPVYAGAYVYGKSESRTVIVDGQARRTANNPKPREQWSIVILDHHPGYICWEQYERNQKLMAENNYVRSAEGRKAADVYMGVFWNNKRQRIGATYPYATIAFSGDPMPGDVVSFSIGGTTIGARDRLRRNAPGSRVAFPRRHHGMFAGVWADDGFVTSTTLRIQSKAPRYVFTGLAVSAPNSVMLTLSDQIGTEGDEGDWEILDSASPVMTEGARRWIKDLASQFLAAGIKASFAFSIEVYNPPTAMRAKYLRLSGGLVTPGEDVFLEVPSYQMHFGTRVRN